MLGLPDRTQTLMLPHSVTCGKIIRPSSQSALAEHKGLRPRMGRHFLHPRLSRGGTYAPLCPQFFLMLILFIKHEHNHIAENHVLYV